MGLLEEKNALLNSQRHAFYNELLELKGQMMSMRDDDEYKPEIKCKFCAEFLTREEPKEESAAGEEAARGENSQASQELREEVVALQQRVEILKKERYEARRDLNAVQFEASTKEASAQAAAKDMIDELTNRLESESQSHQEKIEALEELLRKRVNALEKEREELHLSIEVTKPCEPTQPHAFSLTMPDPNLTKPTQLHKFPYKDDIRITVEFSFAVCVAGKA